VSACPNGYYASGTACVPCHVTCKTCTGGLNSNCLTCYSYRWVSLGACVAQCPNGTYVISIVIMPGE
jgi:hypothetical protein